MTEISIKEWIKNFDKGEYESSDIDTQIKAGWYDWFCKDSSLAKKTQSLGKKLKMIAKSSKIDINKSYVFFKNNCPMIGNLYDDFRISDLKTGNVIFTITPKYGNKGYKGLGAVWGKENSFSVPLIEGTWKEIKNWFLKEN